MCPEPLRLFVLNLALIIAELSSNPNQSSKNLSKICQLFTHVYLLFSGKSARVLGVVKDQGKYCDDENSCPINPTFVDTLNLMQGKISLTICKL